MILKRFIPIVGGISLNTVVELTEFSGTAVLRTGWAIFRFPR